VNITKSELALLFTRDT